MRHRLPLILALILIGSGAVHAQPSFLRSPEFAREIVLQYRRVPAGTERFAVGVRLQVTAPWHIYANPATDPNRKATELTLKLPPGLELAAPIQYPPGVEKSYGEGQSYRVYEGPTEIVAYLRAAASLPPGPLEIPAEISYLACDDRGRCKTVTTYPFSIALEIAPPGTPLEPTGWAPATPTGPSAGPPAPSATPTAAAGTEDIALRIKERGLFLTLLFVFAMGLAINLTPCVFPLIPVTIGFFGMQAGQDRRRTFQLALAYVLGMVLMYSSLGVFAAAAGKAFGFATQSPWVNGGIAVVIAVLALSMFGLYELRPPSFVMAKSQARSGVLGALMMGLIVGIAAAPCSGPVVLGLMAFISKTGDLTLGVLLFLTLALGLGLPFLVLGMSTSLVNALPRSGPWMELTKRIFGVLMLYGALMFAKTLMPRSVYAVFSSAFWLPAGVYLLFAEPELAHSRGAKWVKTVAGALACAAGIYLLARTGLQFEHRAQAVKWPPATEAALASARQAGKPVILDFRTPACAACDELEEFTFSDPRVQEIVARYAAFQVDWNGRDPYADRLVQQYQIQGFPNVMFFAPDGREFPELRLTQFEPAEKFLQRLARYEELLKTTGAATAEAP